MALLAAAGRRRGSAQVARCASRWPVALPAGAAACPACRRGYRATPPAAADALGAADMVAWHDGASVIESVSPNGLIGVNSVTIQGSVMVFPRLCLLWHVKSLEDVDDDSLSLLSVYHPRPEHFILGVGESTPALPPSIVDYCKRNGITAEAMSRQHAASTFNFMNQEGRHVVAAFPHAAPHVT